MSWFKKEKMESKITDRLSDNGSTSSGRSRTDTDPELCLQVFQNHWTQALGVIKVKGNVKAEGHSLCTSDDVEAVIQNFEQMINLLAAEEGLDENGQGMPGPILHYLLENDIFENFCNWCQNQPEYGEKLKLEQLRMFEILIGQSQQLLLIHRAVIHPLLRLLSACSEDTIAISSKIERRLVLILHQICASISQQTLILESFFNTNANHGPAKFLIFSLLIPFIHREGTVGQQARDALLLIMTLSSKHPHVGEFIAKHSDFCPVLATGLSGLYSSLPRKIPVPTEDWFQITQFDINQIPGIQMILNSLEFCNAVIQISHSVISDQLTDYIFKGFLVPVMGPALHQNSREEVIAATAYLELFLRKISEPDLIKTFLKFILTEQNDEIVILESLVTRINSSNKLLCVVSLSLFKTLIDLNCEDVMFQLVLRYLIPCTHVMVSQRRSVKDVDLYGKSAEKFLSLRPICCVPDLSDSPKVTNTPPSSQTDRFLANHGNNSSSSATQSSQHALQTRPKRGLGSFLRARKREQESQRRRAVSTMESPKQQTAFPPGTFGSKLEHYETNYSDYLLDARHMLERTCKACACWSYPYNGDRPPPNVFSEAEDLLLGIPNDRLSSVSTERNLSIDESKRISESLEDETHRGSSTSSVQIVSHGGSTVESSDADSIRAGERDFKSYLSLTTDDIYRRESLVSPDNSVQSEVSDILKRFNSESSDSVWMSESDDVSDFISYLTDVGTPPDQEVSLEDSMKSLDSVLSNLSLSISRTSTPFTESGHHEGSGLDTSLGGNDMNATGLMIDNSLGSNNNSEDKRSMVAENVINCSSVPTSTNNFTSYDVIDSKILNSSENETDGSSKTTDEVDGKKNNPQNPNDTSFVEITLSAFSHGANVHDTLPKLQRTNSVTSGQELQSPNKSVSFSLPCSSMQASTTLSSGIIPVPSGESHTKAADGQPNIGPFLSSLFTKLEGMMQNNLPVNLVLTGVISRLAAYPQPLLRSFLLNHNLVFQPTVKSLVQVLSSVRQKVDNYSYTVQNFETLLLRARRSLAAREENFKLGFDHVVPVFSPSAPISSAKSPQTSPTPPIIVKEKRKVSLTDLLFKRSPRASSKQKLPAPKRGGPQLELIPGRGFRYVNRRQLPSPPQENPVESSKTRNAVYCALILEEFVKELAALSQEHSILMRDEGYYSN